MDLYLCEKPDQGRSLAAVLGVNQRAEGYMHDGGSRVVTWAIGHLLELYMPDDYDPALKRWSMDTLPISPETWKYHVNKRRAKQFNVVKAQLAKASTVFIATDLDREGESIARSLLDRCQYRGEVRRVGLRALDDKSIRKALGDIRPGDETVSLYYAALSRQRADWLIGMNMSRLYTELARRVGYTETLHIGRIITPTVSLVCDRDKQIAGFKPSPFHVLRISVSVQNGAFMATWVPPEELADEQGRCLNKTYAEQVARQVQGAEAVISRAEVKGGHEHAPLPFNLTSLQQYASKRWGYTAEQTLDGAQALYETHKATTYPRTDSRYLPVSQREDIADTLQSLITSDPDISGLVAGADPDRESRAYNDEKVTAHHAIIPTPSATDISKMSELERHLYDAIRRFYIAQFYHPFEFKRTALEVAAGKHVFTAAGKVPIKQGWKVIFGSDAESSPQDDSQDAADAEENPGESTLLPKVRQGEPALIQSGDLIDKMTRPAPHFTESALLGAMENVARFVSEPRFKQILKETSGLGTSATRAGIIKGAVDKGYLKRQKKVLRATDKAYALVSIVPEAIKSPGMTAAWEQQLDLIAAGDANMRQFMQQIDNWVCSIVNTVKTNAATLSAGDGQLQTTFAGAKPTTHACFTCGSELRRIRGKNGFFWSCCGAACRKTFPDERGKPVLRDEPDDAPLCPDCSESMRLRSGKAPGKKRASKFWGCTGYPECQATMPYQRKRQTEGSR